MRRILVALLGLAIIAELAIALLLIGDFEWSGVVVIIFTVASGAVGMLLVSRVPGHPIGWLLLVASITAATGALAVTYAEAALAEAPGSLPVSHWVIWLGELAFLSAAAILSTFLLLLFPTGRLVSPRWRFVVGLATLGILMMGTGRVLSPESFDGLPISNPVALDQEDLLLILVDGGGFYLLTLAIILSVWSLFRRYRRGSALERQQLKWAVFGMAIATVGIVGPAVWELVNGTAEIPSEVENLLVMFGLTIVPVVIGLAVLRYRLYDIDRIISRTVSYALVVGLLALVFAAGVVVVPNAVPVLEDNPVLVAVSTLIAAGLFNPLRRRVQVIVDRRFNRSRYDAERVIERFSDSLRERVDPEGVLGGWVGVVSDTMQPSGVGVWVR